MPELRADAPPPRLCCIRKSYAGEEYGFNLHAEKGRGQFIGKIDPMSPAERGGLREGDKIVGVNGGIVLGETHAMVVSRIKQDPDKAMMMVIDDAGLAWYRENDVPFSWDQSNVIVVDEKIGSPGPGRTVVEVSPDIPEIPAPDYMNGQAQSPRKPMPRLCHLKKVMTSDEYGFNLHAEKGKGHFIGLVDSSSIGQMAGLERGQRIVGVNGTLIYPTTPHKEVVTLIREDGMATQLLVASEAVDAWYQSNNEEFDFNYAEVVKSDLPSPGYGYDEQNSVPFEVEPTVHQEPERVSSSSSPRSSHSQSSPSKSPIQIHTTPHVDDTTETQAPLERTPKASDNSTSSGQSSTRAGAYPVHKDSPPPPIEPESVPQYNGHASGHGDAIEVQHSPSPTSPNESVVSNDSVTTPHNASNATRDGRTADSFLNMSLSEAKQRAASRRKRDPRDQPMSLAEKHDIVKNL